MTVVDSMTAAESRVESPSPPRAHGDAPGESQDGQEAKSAWRDEAGNAETSTTRSGCANSARDARQESGDIEKELGESRVGQKASPPKNAEAPPHPETSCRGTQGFRPINAGMYGDRDLQVLARA